jgi:nucleotide-binding universal stress UspA family protein
MTYKTIVVHLDCGKQRSERLDLALALAQEFDAYVVGLFALDIIQSSLVPEDAPVLRLAEERRRERCGSDAAQEFDSKTFERKIKGEWRATVGDAVGSVCFAARYADLVVIGQTSPGSWLTDGLPKDFAADVVLSAGKPVLIVPFAGHFGHVGKRALIAWNAARESALAVSEALPVLQRSDSVDVISFERGRRGEELPPELEREEMAKYLGRHGVSAKVWSDPAPDGNIGSLILARAADRGADAVVMGAYGHSRLREHVLGGTTQKVLESMTLPVLMSH